MSDRSDRIDPTLSARLGVDLDVLLSLIAERVAQSVGEQLAETTPPPSPWMTTEQACRHSGLRKGTFKQHAAAGRFRRHRAGRRWLYHREELDDDLRCS